MNDAPDDVGLARQITAPVGDRENFPSGVQPPRNLVSDPKLKAALQVQQARSHVSITCFPLPVFRELGTHRALWSGELLLPLAIEISLSRFEIFLGC